MQKRNEQNYYFLTIDNSRMIDAGPKGNLSRLIFFLFLKINIYLICGSLLKQSTSYRGSFIGLFI